MSRLREMLVGAVAGCALATMAGPAFADAGIGGYQDIWYDECKEVPYYLYFSMPGASSWSYDVRALSPNGIEIDHSIVVGTGEAGDSANDPIHVCPSDGSGLYRVSGTVGYYDENQALIGSEQVTGTFVIRRQQVVTYVKVRDATPRFGSIVRLVARSKQQIPGHYRMNAFERISLQIRCPGTGWTRVRKSDRTTDKDGMAYWRYRWNIRPTCEVRAVTPKSVSEMKSKSAPVRVNPWGRVAP